MAGRRRPVAADELVSDLEPDPELIAGRADLDRKRQAAAAAFDESAKPIRAALRAAGLPDAGFGTFVSSRGAEYVGVPEFDDREAVPILIEWLSRVDDSRVKEAIVRHLSTRHAKPVAARPLIEAFQRTPPDRQGLKWAIGNALDVVADSSVLPELLELAQDRSHGAARQMIVLRLGKAPKRPEIAEALVSLLEDEDVSLHAMSAVRQQLGPEEARAHIGRLEHHPSEKIRGHARRETKKIDRILAEKLERR